ncbi:MAG: signal peptidase I [Tepidiphilus sp.]|jgi:signal peptidase I|uniref:Signal peptidase I n=1 Tax=Tepidiphilus thermophilus TaxID=876478 RepID=A0A0K6IXY5_9PROT|nr:MULTISPECIES: signal peptidase I [Tepidiphilus]MBP6998767.1 signal peptidase I [Tepidiphilus sp.]MDK2797785.1 signal peptidase [Tepidiphilus sp.]CUB07924.1 signal peptidase I . Serine peptidase. MEROPS family S26A [Tepidiphilus thermophilus]
MNFALILFLLTLATGVLWAFDRWVAGKRRPEGAPAPWWVEYGASFFPVILAVFALRSFVVEPFKIPSGSMIPTLLVGDFILVDKFSYGIRLPLLNRVVIPVGHPQRGEVMVFRYPADPSVDYIKRVVGLPGDYVEYLDKKLRINGVPVQYDPLPDYFHPDRLYYSTRWREHLGEHPHDILVDDVAPPFVTQRLEFPYADRCEYNRRGVRCFVPPGHYFVMGDNRDGSSDSRVWGFVPEENIVGKAFFIWLNLSDLSRIGRIQ